MNDRPASGTSLRKPLIFLAVVVALALLTWYASRYLSLEELANQEDQIREYITLNHWRAFSVAFGIYLALAFVPGTGGKAVVWGWFFGFWEALVTVSVGLTIAAMVIFSLSRYLFRETIERRYANLLSIMNTHLEKEGVFYLLTLRMAHAPFSIVNPVSGASRVPAWTFFWTTAIGLLPANSIWVFVGISLPSLRELANNGPASLIDAPLVASLILCATLPFLIRWSVKFLLSDKSS